MGKKRDFFESVEAEIVGSAQDYIKKKVVNKFLKISEISIFALMALVLIIIGLTNLIATYFPILSGGWNYIIMGVVFLLLALSIKM